jgi:Tfp pilus assembly protein PilP
MKLIQILALVTAMAMMAAAQNTGASGQQPASKATPTPGITKASPATKQQSTGAKAPATGAAQSQPAPGGAASKNAASKSGTGATPPVVVVTPTKGGTAAQGTGSAPSKTGTAAAKTGAAASKTGTAAASKTGSAAATKTGQMPAAKITAAPPTTGTKTGKKGAKQSAVVAAAKASKKPAKAPTKTAAKTTAKSTPPTPAPVAAVKPRIGALGRRDPFVSPIRVAGPSGPGANCTGGKRCLSIPELVLAGTVKDISGRMMAVVVTSAKKTYTLRENDQVFNGSVEKITSDSVIFREFVKDAVGHETAREVVKKLNPGPVT